MLELYSDLQRIMVLNWMLIQCISQNSADCLLRRDNDLSMTADDLGLVTIKSNQSHKRLNK